MLDKILLGGLVGYVIGKHSQRTPIDADSDGHYSLLKQMEMTVTTIHH